jgi:DNA helicase-2/ATP-dependent DNA helicase PcrA
MWIGTFHATCARLLRKYGEVVGLTKSFMIFDDDDQIKLVDKLLKETGLDEQVSARTVLSRFDRAKNRGVDPREVKTGAFDDVIERVFPLYEGQLRRENAVDFNDLLLRVLDLFKIQSTGQILRTRFSHVLVDEFQDTNRVQYELVRQFAEATRNLTVVGDDDQSIYAWRGAEPRNLLDFDRDFADATVVKLEQNYRSTQMILDAANGIIRKNRDRHEKSLWTEQGGGDPIEIYQAGDERGEAYFVAQSIRRMLDDGPQSPNDFAILYRTNAQSRVLEEHLRAARIPAKVVGAVSFFERKACRGARGGRPASRSLRRAASGRRRPARCGAAGGAQRGGGARRRGAQEAARVRRVARRSQGRDGAGRLGCRDHHPGRRSHRVARQARGGRQRRVARPSR